MKRLFTVIAGLLLATALSSCATLFKGVNSNVTVHATAAGVEAGAHVFVNGVDMGATPVKLNMSAKAPVTITLKKDGYADQTYTINNRLGTQWVILDVLAGFWPIIIDLANGAWYEFDPGDVNVTLTPGTMNQPK
ncbi:MAG TPA: PEGA domain-containing protein [Deinococcales bacterium]|nr:PEGA domain-containing protein [Deinococcales bacterium]